ncbi:MAG: amino acid deaminase/aldolase [Actinobacteria bacterium]|nr:amino acid deaminase/aldolase [Actinomycetota bacterium]
MNALERLNRATTDLDPPFALVDLGALNANALDMERRAAPKPIRLASKSVRCRAVQTEVLSRSGFEGTLAFTLREALWLHSHGFDDIVVAYPTADRGALRDLAWKMGEDPGARIAIMVDSVEHLDFIDRATGTRGTSLRLCLDIDAGWWLAGGRVRIGAKRSPLHDASQARALARVIEGRPGFELVGIMAYEAQIAGVGNRVKRKPLRSFAVRTMQARSARELAERRAEIAAAVREVSTLEFVNGGGTGSLEGTAVEAAVTEVAGGSGLYGPGLFDSYRAFTPQPAAIFALPVVRRPSDRVATVLGGGYLASGPADRARLPIPHLPEGLKLDAQEGAGEVQTPLHGTAAASLGIGDRVYFRHAKAGELCERFDRLYLVDGERVVGEVPTYRGEGQCFL